MPDFTQQFVDSKGQPIVYNVNALHSFDRFPVHNGDALKISIESTNNQRPQGLVVDITGSCEMGGEIFKQGKGVRMFFWGDAEHTDRKNIEIKDFTKLDNVIIYNVWKKKNHYLMSAPDGKPMQKESSSVEYWHGGAAMIIEEIPNGRRYRCNDGTPDDDFNDIVFSIQRI